MCVLYYYGLRFQNHFPIGGMFCVGVIRVGKIQVDETVNYFLISKLWLARNIHIFFYEYKA